jgi:hypothetical protein
LERTVVALGSSRLARDALRAVADTVAHVKGVVGYAAALDDGDAQLVEQPTRNSSHTKTRVSRFKTSKQLSLCNTNLYILLTCLFWNLLSMVFGSRFLEVLF